MCVCVCVCVRVYASVVCRSAAAYVSPCSCILHAYFIYYIRIFLPTSLLYIYMILVSMCVYMNYACVHINLLHATYACVLIVYMNLLHVILAFTLCHVRSGFMFLHCRSRCTADTFLFCVCFVCIHACVRVGLTYGVSTSTCVYAFNLSQRTQYDAEERP
jgi:hypothetical protein